MREVLLIEATLWKELKPQDRFFVFPTEQFPLEHVCLFESNVFEVEESHCPKESYACVFLTWRKVTVAV